MEGAIGCRAMSRGRQYSFWRWAFCAAVLLWGAMSVTAQDTPPAAETSVSSGISPQSLQPSSTTSKWDDIETRLETLLQAAEQSSMDWDELLTELAQLRAEAEQLRSDSQKSSSSFEDYERRTNERIVFIEAKALRAEKSRDRWRAGALTAAAIALLEGFLLLLF